MVWDLDEWVTAEQNAAPSVEEMQAFDSLPATVKAELRRTGESALAYLEHQRKRRAQAKSQPWDDDW